MKAVVKSTNLTNRDGSKHKAIKESIAAIMKLNSNKKILDVSYSEANSWIIDKYGFQVTNSFFYTARKKMAVNESTAKARAAKANKAAKKKIYLSANDLTMIQNQVTPNDPINLIKQTKELIKNCGSKDKAIELINLL